jgi:hypothetical protein
VRGEGIFFFDLCSFTLCDFSVEHNCCINWGVPVLRSFDLYVVLYALSFSIVSMS